MLLFALSCNTAPTAYQTDEVALGGTHPWDHPTDDACADKDDGLELHGFTWCNQYPSGIVPVDDPVLEPCSEVEVDAGEQVFWAFDGVHARAYVTAQMVGRELVHDEWGEIPVLVDW